MLDATEKDRLLYGPEQYKGVFENICLMQLL